MNAIAFSKANLPSVQNLSQALRSLDASVGGSAGTPILKMDKTGHWVFGGDQTEVEDGSTWAVNPFSFVHGYIAWGNGEVLGEHMVPVNEPLPELDTPPAGSERGWELQVGMGLKCMSGEDEGLEVRYSVTSVGGKRAVQKLALDIAAQVETDPSKPVPVVKLKKDHYTHKSYGRIFTPVFEIVGWMGLDGKQDDVPPADAAPAAEAAPVRRRRAV
jgi:hypothetical protein